MDDPWLEALATVRAEVDAQTRDDAVEVFVAEASRVRLVDRAGPARVTLRSGTVLTGTLAPHEPDDPDGEPVADVLRIHEDSGRTSWLPVASVLRITGTRQRLRPEPSGRRERTLASVLRDCWTSGGVVRALTTDGTWVEGRLAMVGADHAMLRAGDDLVVLPFAAVEAWQVAAAG